MLVPFFQPHQLPTVTRELLREHGRRSNPNVARNWRQIVPRPVFFNIDIPTLMADYHCIVDLGRGQSLLKMNSAPVFFGITCRQIHRAYYPWANWIAFSTH